MNNFNVTVYDTIGGEHTYYVTTEKDKKEVMNDINAAWNNERSIQINYREGDKENIAIFDSKKVIGIDLKVALSLDEMIKNIDFRAHVMSVPCEQVEKTEVVMDTAKGKKRKMSGKEKLDEIKSKLW